MRNEYPVILQQYDGRKSAMFVDVASQLVCKSHRQHKPRINIGKIEWFLIEAATQLSIRVLRITRTQNGIQVNRVGVNDHAIEESVQIGLNRRSRAQRAVHHRLQPAEHLRFTGR